MTLKQIASLGKELAKFLVLVRRPLPQPPRFRLVVSLCPGLALEPATQKHRGHGLGIGYGTTDSTTFRGIDQVG